MRAAALAEVSNLTPATDHEFITILTPCLQLVAPVGMGQEAQDMWFEAARLALADVPASLLKRGAQRALMHADHPAKIVALIIREIGDALETRRRIARGRDDQPTHSALPAPGQEYATKDEIAAICRQFKVGSYSEHKPTSDPRDPTPQGALDPARPCRKPTREDYIRMGVDPAVLDAMNAPQADAA